MRVGIVSEWFSRGAGYVGKQYMDALLRQGIFVSVYSRGDRHTQSQPEWQSEHIHVGTNCRIRRPKAIYYPDFRDWVLREQIDSVIFNEQQWLPPVLWARELGLKTIAYVDYYTRESVSSFEWYDALICNTRRHASTFEWHPGVNYIPWGTDLTKFTAEPRPERPLTFLHSAGWDPTRKGTEQVLRVWQKLRQGTRLIVHSQADLKPILSRLDLSNELRDGSLQILGSTIDPPKLFSMGDVYVYPTMLEGIGLTIIEALASGLPIIVPDDGPMNEYLLNEYSTGVSISKHWFRDDGYFWPCNAISDEHLFNAMDKYTDRDSAEIEKWRVSTRDVAETNLDWFRNSLCLGPLLSKTEIREVDKMKANERMRVYPEVAKVGSWFGMAAGQIFGDRIVSDAH